MQPTFGFSLSLSLPRSACSHFDYLSSFVCVQHPRTLCCFFLLTAHHQFMLRVPFYFYLCNSFFLEKESDSCSNCTQAAVPGQSPGLCGGCAARHRAAKLAGAGERQALTSTHTASSNEDGAVGHTMQCRAYVDGGFCMQALPGQ